MIFLIRITKLFFFNCVVHKFLLYFIDFFSIPPSSSAFFLHPAGLLCFCLSVLVSGFMFSWVMSMFWSFSHTEMFYVFALCNKMGEDKTNGPKCWYCALYLLMFCCNVKLCVNLCIIHHMLLLK